MTEQLVMWECFYKPVYTAGGGLDGWRAHCPSCGAIGTYQLRVNAEKWSDMHMAHCPGV